MQYPFICPHCGKSSTCYRNPSPTADVIIYTPQHGVVIIRRAHEPLGYALPGGFIEEGECAEAAALREMREETGMDVTLTGILGVYSRPDRDPRQHTITVVFTAYPCNPQEIQAGDDAAQAAFYPLDGLPQPLVFDHQQIMKDFAEVLAGRRSLAAVQPLWPTTPGAQS